MGQESQNELQDLVAVHKFYVCLLEKFLGHSVPVPADVDQALSVSSQDGKASAQQLKSWLDLLDMAITPPMVRDSLKRTQDLQSAHALLRYFVTKASQRASDRDKTDCICTYLFRNPDPESSQKWQRPETDSSYYFLTHAATAFQGEMRRAMGEMQFEALPNEHAQLLREFEFFHQELEEFRHFDQITDCAMVQRVRELKQSLGKSFYHPESLGQIAVWNDVFGRKFDDLFHDATKQIKTFADHVTREGGSIMSRVEGDITVKHLSEIETQQILTDDYQNAQDQFRKVSKYKKAVDSKRSSRPVIAPVAPRGAPAAAPAVPAPAVAASAPPAPPVVMPTAAAVMQPSASNRATGKPEAEVLAVAPSQAVQNAVQEGKIHSTRETIKNHVRNADPKFAAIVSVKRSKITLTPAEVEAFRADFGGEKSFRADYANIMMVLVAYLARMIIEVDEYQQKAGSAYLWKPHADALSYLLSTLERIGMEADQVKNTARQRGLQDKAQAVEASMDKLRKYAQTVSETLHATDQSFTG